MHQQTLKCKNFRTYRQLWGFHRVEAVCDVHDAYSLNHQFTEVLGLFLLDAQEIRYLAVITAPSSLWGTQCTTVTALLTLI